MNLETKITIYKFTPQLFTLTRKKCLNKTKPTKRTIKLCSFSWLLYQFNCLTAAMYQSNMCSGMDVVLNTPVI